MKTIIFTLISIFLSLYSSAQNSIITPLNNSVDKRLIKNEVYRMNWYIKNGDTKIEIGKINTEIKKNQNNVLIITTVEMIQAQTKWVDTTIASIKELIPIYHSSFNKQRDMVLNFDKKVTGYYFDKQTNTKTQISETADKPFFDSNFYPQLIRLLPLKEGYTNTISIFDYNPKSKTGVITATIKNTVETTIEYKGELRQVWKVETTDDISNNTAISAYFIDKSTRQLLRQGIDFGGRKMIMKLID